MNDFYFPNPFPDYDEKVKSDYLGTTQTFRSDLMTNVEHLMNEYFQGINSVSEYYGSRNDLSVYNGYSGIAYLNLFNYLKGRNAESLKIAGNIIEKALLNLNDKCISFLIGDAGPLALASVIYALQNKEKHLQMVLDRLVTLAQTVQTFPDNFLFGRAGYLYALLFVNKFVEEAIPNDYIAQQCKLLIRSGKKRAEVSSFSAPLKYYCEQDCFLGISRGLAGVLYVLLQSHHVLSDRILDLYIKPCLDWLITKRYSDGNFPSTYESWTNRLVQWCHGATGFVHLYTLAGQIFQEDYFTSVAKECGEVVWSRGLLKKGHSLCHGVPGNAYAFAHLYKVTYDSKYLHRLGCFLKWCTDYQIQDLMKPKRRLSLFEGLGGLTYFYFDMQDVYSSAFPAFDLS